MSEIYHDELNLAQQYMLNIKKLNFYYDEQQYEAALKIGNLITNMLKVQKNIFSKTNYLLTNKFSTVKKKRIFYIYGSVGSGKSFLTTLIIKYFPSRRKLKLSFYNFIENLRAQTNKTLAGNNSTKDNLAAIIKKELKNIDLLCIDEFHILDIADATMLIEFFKVLIQMPNIIVIINSNRAVEDLYKEGIHKERFIPAMELIKENAHIIALSTKDYRSHMKEIPGHYFVIGKNKTIKQPSDLLKLFNNEAGSRIIQSINYNILSQPINFFTYEDESVNELTKNTKIAFFEFENLFSQPFYANNYQKLLGHFNFKKIYLNNIPKLDNENDKAKRFIAFIDVAYEIGLTMTISSYFNYDELYNVGKVAFEFERTISRIKVLCK